MQQDPAKFWFGLSMVLIGVIVGFTAAKTVNFSGSLPSPTGVAQPKQPTAGKPTPSSAAAPDAPSVQNVQVPDAKEHLRGTANALITIIEYSDLECPFCARVHPTIKQAVDDYDGKVNWVFRHYPLSFHANAQKAAEATECATELGGNDKFWAMTDMLYEKGSDNSQLGAYAKAIGLNEAAFKTCLDSGKFAQKIDDMMQTGVDAGVQGTPGNIIYNNKTKAAVMVSGAQPIANFKTAIDGLLK